MTENKRFTDVWCSETGHIGVTDNGIDKKFTGSEFEEWLNALHEENTKLKKNFDSCSHNWGIMYDEAKSKVEELSNENWQLKQLVHQLNEKRTELLRLINNNIEIYKNIKTDLEFHKGEIQGKLTLLQNLKEVIMSD